MVAFCLVAAFLTLILGVLSLSNGMMGVGGIGVACFWAILARIAQADVHYKRVMAPAQTAPVPVDTSAKLSAIAEPQLPAARVPSSPGVRKLTANLPGTARGFFVEVVGAAQHQPALKMLSATAGKNPIRVLLHPEPDNPYDEYAVAVKSFEGERLGYLSREVAERYHAILLALRERGQTGVCDGQLHVGSDEKSHVSIRVDLDSPARVAAAVADYARELTPSPTAALDENRGTPLAVSQKG